MNIIVAFGNDVSKQSAEPVNWGDHTDEDFDDELGDIECEHDDD
jgi:hypothetical protein